MSSIDLLVLFGTLGTIVIYGVWKTRGSKNIEGYLLGDNTMKWGTIGLSVMATQASAITFLSTPGQAYEDGLGFVQNYFSLLLVILSMICPILYENNSANSINNLAIAISCMTFPLSSAGTSFKG